MSDHPPESQHPPEAQHLRGAGRGRGRSLLIVALMAAVVVGVGGFLLLGGDDPAPGAHLDVPIELPDGDTTTLAELEGTPVVVNFFASWCAPCRAELPDFQQVSEELDGEVAFISVAELDRPEEAGQLIAETGVTYPWGLDDDSTLFEELGGDVMPTTVLLRADGSVAEVHGGVLTADSLTALIDRELR